MPGTKTPKKRVFKSIPIKSIDSGGQNHRDTSKPDAELSTSMAELGQIVPIIVVCDHIGGFSLGAGARRLEAAKMLGWDEIFAEVLPEGSSLEMIRATENLQRQELNPIEEAVAVAQVLEDLAATESTLGGVSSDAAIGRAADRLGKTKGWVRDRTYLARLSGKSKKLVVQGRLTLGHARELAKLADPGLRDYLAERASRREDMTGGMSVKELASCVERDMTSLRVVPWDTTVRFAGKPACDSCPHNTANDLHLFDSGGERPENPTCTEKRCFESKQRKATSTIEAGIAGLKAIPKADRPTITTAGLRDRIPAGIKPGTFVRKAQAVASLVPKNQTPSGKKAGAKKKSAGSSESKQNQLPSRSPKELLSVAVGGWEHKIADLLLEHCKVNPTRAVGLVIFMHGKEVYGNRWCLQRVLSKPSVRVRFKWLKDQLSTEQEIAEGVGTGASRGLVETRTSVAAAADDWGDDLCIDLPGPFVLELAQAWKLDLPAKPVLADFNPDGEKCSKCNAHGELRHPKRHWDKVTCSACKGLGRLPEAAAGSAGKDTESKPARKQASRRAGATPSKKKTAKKTAKKAPKPKRNTRPRRKATRRAKAVK